ncbi:MAG: IS630 family transposase, partial [Terriglobia bacterium]
AWTADRKPGDGSRHWSSRKLAAALGDISHMTVARIWAKHGVKPDRLESYLASNDPDFETGVADMIGLYLNPPQHAAVFSIVKHAAILALDRNEPAWRMLPGGVQRYRLEYVGERALQLYAALNIKAGDVPGNTVACDASAELVTFLTGIVRSQAEGPEIHVIADNLSAQRSTRLLEFLAEHRNVHMHFTLTNKSWLNQVESWFAKMERAVDASRHLRFDPRRQARTHLSIQRTAHAAEVEILRSIVANYSRINRYNGTAAASVARFLDIENNRRYVESKRGAASHDSARFGSVTGSVDRRKNIVATAIKRKVSVESAEAVFGLHWFVAKGDGLFAEEGLDVEILRPKPPAKFGPNDPRRFDHHLVNSGNYQNLFEERKCDGYRSCEWGQIRRTYDVKREGPIAWKRAPVICQAVFVRPESPVNAPSQLANKTVGVQFHQGSHYVTIAMLEGFMPADAMKLVHAGTSHERYEPLEKGEVEAATLVEPWITLAEKNGFKKICETHYLGLENFAPDLEPETIQALMRALRKAVKNINADKKRYLHYLIDEMPERYRKQITPDDFYLPRLRHMDLAPYSRQEFEHASEWMKKWDLLPKDASYESLVANVA